MLTAALKEMEGKLRMEYSKELNDRLAGEFDMFPKTNCTNPHRNVAKDKASSCCS